MRQNLQIAFVLGASIIQHAQLFQTYRQPNCRHCVVVFVLERIPIATLGCPVVLASEIKITDFDAFCGFVRIPGVKLRNPAGSRPIRRFRPRLPPLNFLGASWNRPRADLNRSAYLCSNFPPFLIPNRPPALDPTAAAPRLEPEAVDCVELRGPLPACYWSAEPPCCAHTATDKR